LREAQLVWAVCTPSGTALISSLVDRHRFGEVRITFWWKGFGKGFLMSWVYDSPCKLNLKDDSFWTLCKNRVFSTHHVSLVNLSLCRHTKVLVNPSLNTEHVKEYGKTSIYTRQNQTNFMSSIQSHIQPPFYQVNCGESA
jgi:hypothetical protein